MNFTRTRYSQTFALNTSPSVSLNKLIVINIEKLLAICITTICLFVCLFVFIDSNPRHTRIVETEKYKAKDVFSSVI